jgi:hypothetical protein
MLKVFTYFVESFEFKKRNIPVQQLSISKEQSVDFFTALSLHYAPGVGFIHRRNNVHKLQAVS